MDIIYIVHPNNLEKRVLDHKKEYSKYTVRANDWELFYSENKELRSGAQKVRSN